MRCTAVASDQSHDARWRLNNLYYITNEKGERVPFRMNWAQEQLWEDGHYQNLILKARQLGFTTFIQLIMLDACVFTPNMRCGTIAHNLEDARVIFRDKVKYPYDQLPDGLKRAVHPVQDSTQELLLSNNSSIRVGTSMRSGTLQYLHVSEYGKICAKYPEKAREVRTGALNTIQAGQYVFIESTAEGQDGDFYAKCENAQAKARMGTKLTPLDLKFHFFPWWKADKYEIDPDGVVVSDDLKKYFEGVEGDINAKLSDRQRAWYVKKLEEQQDDMKREFPSTPKEAFEASVEGAILGPQMAAAELEGRIGDFPAEKDIPVHTFWDIGRRDYTSIWFGQILMGPKVRLVGFYQNCMTGMPHYAEYCKDRYKAMDWNRGTDFFPHDAKVVEWGSDKSRIEQLKKAGFNPKIGVELGLHDGINAARATLPFCEFDEAGTGDGLSVLKSYRWEWDEKLGAWKTGTPRHDTSSHGSDAFRTLGTSWREIVPDVPNNEPPKFDMSLTQPPTLDELWDAHQKEQNESNW